MKKRLFTLVLIFSMLCSFAAFANVKSELLPAEVESSYVTSQGNTRGEYIALATASITNLGDGYMEVQVSTSAHTYCDRIKMRMYVDKYNESKDTWENIKTFNYDVTSDDVGGELYLAVESEEISVQKGYYYRVRGIHTVYKDGKTEGFSTASNGVLAD